MKASTSKEPCRERGYPRKCALCRSNIDYYDHTEFGRHLRLAHATKEGGSFTCRYGENNVCQKLPLEGVSDYDYETHLRKFHTIAEGPEKVFGGMSDSNLSGQPFTINSAVQSVWCAVADPNRSRTDLSTLFTRHWGEAFSPLATPPPFSSTLSHSSFSAQPHYQRCIQTYRKFAQTKKAVKKQKQLADNEEKADVQGLPPVFINEYFDLSAPDTFCALFMKGHDEDILSPNASHSRRPSAPPKNPFEEPQPSKNPFEESGDGQRREHSELQAKLDAFHDIVDARLAARLRAKTSAFFRIVGSYSSLQKDIERARTHIIHVRSSLRCAAEVIVDRTNRVIRLYELRQNKMKLLTKLRDMECLRDAQPTVHGLLNLAEYPRALECIRSAQAVLSGPLAGVVAFRHVGAQLVGIREMIGRLLLDELAGLLQKELGVRVAGCPPGGVPGQLPAEAELASLVVGLAQLRCFSFVKMIKHEMAEGMQGVVRATCKTAAVEAGLLAQLGELPAAVSALPFSAWLRLLHSVRQSLFHFLLRIETLERVLLDVVDRVWPEGFPEESGVDQQRETAQEPQEDTDEGSFCDSDMEDVEAKEERSDALPVASSLYRPSPSSAILPTSIDSLSSLRRSLSCILDYATDYALARIARLILSRSTSDERQGRVPVTGELAMLAAAVTSLVAEWSSQGWKRCQADKAQQITAARDKALSRYADSLHRSRKDIVNEVLDKELWKGADIPVAIQRHLDQFMKRVREGVERSSEEWREKGDQAAENEVAYSAVTSPFILLDGQHFIVANSAALTLEALLEHIEAALVLPPSSAPQLLLRTVELLKMFNSRCCQLILGAGALHVVRLKTISVKNLALASRSLEMLWSVIPLFGQAFTSRLPEYSSQLRYFHQVRIDYMDHINEIIAKLVTVIEHHTRNCLSAWSASGAPPSAAIQLLCKQLGKFHQGVHGIIPDLQVEKLFNAVHLNVKRCLGEQCVQQNISPHDILKWGIVSEDFHFYTRAVHAMGGCQSLDLGSVSDILA